jgi:hypothetical protein
MLQIQTLLYETEPGTIERFLSSLAVAVRNVTGRIRLRVGDCSPRPLLAPDILDAWRHEAGADGRVEADYTCFGQNLGFGRGHNRLWREASGAARLLIVNPDAVAAPHLLDRLGRATDARPDCAAVEARQIPLEHPKTFDRETGETPWVTGACVLVDGAAFDAVAGFDEQFFMYAEDVDLSWRLRALGKRLYYCPETFIYHAKRLAGREPVASPAEQHYGPLSVMLLRAKFGREDLNARMLDLLGADPRPECARMLAEYRERRPQIRPASPAECAMATFLPSGTLAEHRWVYPLPERMLVATSPSGGRTDV